MKKTKAQIAYLNLHKNEIVDETDTAKKLPKKLNPAKKSHFGKKKKKVAPKVDPKI